MEIFIQIEKNHDGSHAFQHGGTLQEGWAYWDTDAVPLPESFPWVDIVVEDVTHSAITDGDKVLVAEYTRPEVISAVEREITELDPEPVIPPTNAELEAENKMLRAQIQAAVDRQDFIEDCIAEMAMVVYAV